MSQDAIEAYAWSEDDMGSMSAGACVALVQGRSPEEAVNLLAPTPATSVGSAAEIRWWAIEQDYMHYATAVEAGRRDGWTLVVEHNGFQATRPELLAELSAPGEAVVIYRNVNALSMFLYAKRGKIMRGFDPLAANAMQPVGSPLAEEDGIEFPGPDPENLRPMAASFLLAERLTGVRLVESGLADPTGRIAVGLHPADLS